MNELLNENAYLIDLSNIYNIPDIIYKMSSVLDKEEAQNRKIYLKLSGVNLSGSQLLSIKSLINGMGSTLSCVDTTSKETEKVALALGIPVASYIPQNAKEEPKQTESKHIEENIEINDLSIQQNEQQVETGINEIPQTDEDVQEQEAVSDINVQEKEEQPCISADIVDVTETKSEENLVQEKNSQTEISTNGTYKDELEMIFGSSSMEAGVFNEEQKKPEIYAEREEISDIVVEEEEYTKEDIEIETFPTKYIKQTVRSGQIINYEGNIVIIGDCHVGCEINAYGDITVWGVLSGIAHAGIAGNIKARVRALKMNAIQLRIANCYSRRPDSLNTILVEKTNSFTPEEARIVNGEIVVFKIND